LFAAIQEVWHPAYSKLLAGCTLLSPWRRFYGLGSTWRHYEEAAAAGQLPEGLLPLADSICSFQPVYGQGMTVAALEAEILDKLLTQRSTSSSSSSSVSSQQLGGPTEEANRVLQLSGLAAELQAAVQPTVQAAWDLAVGGDMKFEGAVSSDGPADGGLAGKLAAGYQDALFELVTCDETVREQSRILSALRCCMASFAAFAALGLAGKLAAGYQVALCELADQKMREQLQA
jgi:hypothetical protein